MKPFSCKYYIMKGAITMLRICHHHHHHHHHSGSCNDSSNNCNPCCRHHSNDNECEANHNNRRNSVGININATIDQDSDASANGGNGGRGGNGNAGDGGSGGNGGNGGAIDITQEASIEVENVVIIANDPSNLPYYLNINNNERKLEIKSDADGNILVNGQKMDEQVLDDGTKVFVFKNKQAKKRTV